MKLKKTVILVFVGVMSLLGLLPCSRAAWADDEKIFGFSVSPMTQSIILVPGDQYKGTFKVVNPNSNEQDLIYTIEKRSFYVDEEYNTTYDESDSPIVDWTRINTGESGTIKPNESSDVTFTIDVPESTPAGGQYLAFRVMSQPTGINSEVSNGTAIQEQLVITHLVFAEIAGNTIRNGSIDNISVPSLLTSGDIFGESTITNAGNIHGVANYKLQVFPLFSDEEIYTNEEKPDRRTILPDRTLYNKIAWNETPSIGIFNVVYTVEFEGSSAQVSKLVIVCPIWLMVVILIIIVVLVVAIVIAIKD